MMIDCMNCGNPYDGPRCPNGCADVQRVLDIAYGRDVALEQLEATQDVPQLSSREGVWLVTRHYGFNCAGRVQRGPVNPPSMWVRL